MFELRLNVDVLKNKLWHQICILWSSKTTVWSIYFDGEREAYGIYNDFIGRRIGKFKYGEALSSNKMRMTQVNLWDRVLTNQEIATFAKTCNQGIGDLISWADLYDDTKSSRYSKPSTCKAVPEALSTTATPVTKKPTTEPTTAKATTTEPASR